MRTRKLPLLLLTMMAIAVSAQTPLSDSDLSNAYTLKSIKRQVNLCHDPSIVMDNITNPSSPVCYIYGSHLHHGKTTANENYQQWTTWGANQDVTTASNSLFCNTNGNRSPSGLRVGSMRKSLSWMALRISVGRAQ